MKYQTLYLFAVLSFAQACDSSSSSSKKPGAVTPPVVAGTTPATPTDPSLVTVPGEGDGVTRAAFLKSLGETVALRTSEFESGINEMSSAAESYCSSYSTESLDTLKVAYKKAMTSWQELELYQMGPLTEKTSALKTRIYDWPNVPNLCKVDEQAMFAVEDGAAFVLDTEFNNRIGLFTLEYLIFESSLETTCSSLGANGRIKSAWTALDRPSRLAARCAYMKPVAKDLIASAATLKSSWGTAEDNYLSKKIGDTTAEQNALQEVFNNILYVDIEMKNKKLGIPAGQERTCPSSPSPCVDKQELRFSQFSREAFDLNVAALQGLILGWGNPPQGGLSDVLRHEGNVAGADKSVNNLNSLVNVIQSDKSSFDVLLAAKTDEICVDSQNSWVCKVHAQIKTVVADFKNEYASVLKLTVPVEKQGDND